MRLYATKISHISEALARALVDSSDLEVTERTEFKQDVESILREYLRMEREVTERAKDLMEARGLPYSELYRVKRQFAEDMDFGIGEESLTWISSQLLELFMRSAFVEEIYADDATLRKKMKEVLRRNMQVDEDLDREVQKQLRHLTKGTDAYEIEYQRQMESIKRKFGFE